MNLPSALFPLAYQERDAWGERELHARADGGVDMNSKEPIEHRRTTEHRQPAKPAQPGRVSERAPAVQQGYGALPARFLEGTAWDEV
jgi:hypothetical protein